MPLATITKINVQRRLSSYSPLCNSVGQMLKTNFPILVASVSFDREMVVLVLSWLVILVELNISWGFQKSTSQMESNRNIQ